MSLIGIKRYRREEVDDASLPAFLAPKTCKNLMTEAEQVMLNRMDAIQIASIV